MNREERRQVEELFRDENERESAEELSPSGRYRLLLRGYETRPNAWSYSRGTVYRVSDGGQICDIKRNFSLFHHTFVTKDGQEWLIAGRSYMSQTIVNLETGAEYEPGGDHYDGGAFCWAQCYLSPDGRTLAVDGCIWACPYEYRFFDFTDPSRGWPELPVEPDEGYIPSGEKAPVWLSGDTFECYELNAGAVVARTRLARRGDRMVVVERWIDDAERHRREEETRAEEEEDAWRERFQAEDPIYRKAVELVARYALPDDGSLGWSAYGGPRRLTKYFRRREPRASADLIWFVERGPIQVRLYDTEGKLAGELEFEHSEAGMARAIERIRRVFAGLLE
jgi:hypothetical protein